MSISEPLEARVRRLEEVEAINKLGIMYVHYNDMRDWRAVSDMFTDDAVAEFGFFGRIEGKEGIAKFFRETVTQSLTWGVHKLHNPIIDVSGDKAKARWIYEESATSAPSNRAIWIAGEYSVECIKVNGEWKFDHFVAKDFYVTAYDEGWAKNNQYVDYRE